MTQTSKRSARSQPAKKASHATQRTAGRRAQNKATIRTFKLKRGMRLEKAVKGKP
jgi:hypothetical protein